MNPEKNGATPFPPSARFIQTLFATVRSKSKYTELKLPVHQGCKHSHPFFRAFRGSKIL